MVGKSLLKSSNKSKINKEMEDGQSESEEGSQVIQNEDCYKDNTVEEEDSATKLISEIITITSRKAKGITESMKQALQIKAQLLFGIIHEQKGAIRSLEMINNKLIKEAYSYTVHKPECTPHTPVSNNSSQIVYERATYTDKVRKPPPKKEFRLIIKPKMSQNSESTKQTI